MIFSDDIMDILSKEQRSWNMSRIKGKNSKPEIIVRSILHGLGYRFRLHRQDLPGIPDIILPKHRTIIFVHGCYWHRHKDCRFAYNPKSRQVFWQKKFDGTLQRDKKNYEVLTNMGWTVYVIWECETKNIQTLKSKIKKLMK
jgi:DNA mismatch endonuclease, patch repair protein